MDCRALASHKLPHQSKLFLEYLNNFSKVQAFYAHAPKMSSVTAAARDLDFPKERRSAVIGALRAQNTAFGAGPAPNAAFCARRVVATALRRSLGKSKSRAAAVTEAIFGACA